MASIRARVQAARNIQLTLIANIESLNIVANADIRVGEIRQFCKLRDEGQSLMWVAALHVSQSSEVDDGMTKSSSHGEGWRLCLSLIVHIRFGLGAAGFIRSPSEATAH